VASHSQEKSSMMTTDYKLQTINSPENILFSGIHLLEIEFARPVSEDVVKHALSSMGFNDIILDQSLPTDTIQWGKPNEELVKFRDNPIWHRFIGKLNHPINILNTDLVRWIYQHQIHADFNPFEEKDDKFFPFNLETGKVYDLQFLARMRAQPTRNAICETLALMGFKPIKIIALKRNMRIPGRPNTSITRWYGIAEWSGPDSYISSEDPLYFENVRKVSSS
jgi:hypothetical protein